MRIWILREIGVQFVTSGHDFCEEKLEPIKGKHVSDTRVRKFKEEKAFLED